MLNKDEALKILFEDHIKYLEYMADICALSMTDTVWLRVLRNMSPVLKNQGLDKITFFEAVKPQLTMSLTHIVEFHDCVKLWITYDADVETAALNEFFISGGKYFRRQGNAIDGVTHAIRIDDDRGKHIFGVLTIIVTPDTDKYIRSLVHNSQPH